VQTTKIDQHTKKFFGVSRAPHGFTACRVVAIVGLLGGAPSSSAGPRRTIGGRRSGWSTFALEARKKCLTRNHAKSAKNKAQQAFFATSGLDRTFDLRAFELALTRSNRCRKSAR
jgi:hypothetical protein